MVDKNKLSKNISYILRHSSLEKNIKISSEGWVLIDDLVLILRESGEFKYVEKEDIYNLVSSASKKRHEVEDEKIRALYGHSLDVGRKNEAVVPPIILYHGTTSKSLKKILKEGLKPMNRNYLHLSKDKQTAYDVALRKTSNPIIIKVKSLQAYQEGEVFYQEGDIFLSKSILPKYLEIF